jgi:hypothetical protein
MRVSWASQLHGADLLPSDRYRSVRPEWTDGVVFRSARSSEFAQLTSLLPCPASLEVALRKILSETPA